MLGVLNKMNSVLFLESKISDVHLPLSHNDNTKTDWFLSMRKPMHVRYTYIKEPHTSPFLLFLEDLSSLIWSNLFC